VFVVAAGKAAELAQRLRELGYPPAAGSAPGRDQPAAAATRRPARTGPGRDGDPGRGLLAFEPDDRIPAWEELFPGLDAVPSAWIRQAGRYHVSTRRKLVERALAWRTSLQVTVEGEERPRTFVPEALEADGAGWRVAGRFRNGDGPGERLALAGDALAELRIKLPERESAGTGGVRTKD
jgi:hypothetical protein